MYVTELFPFCCHEDYHPGRLECLCVCVCVGGNWGHCYSSTSTENLEEEAADSRPKQRGWMLEKPVCARRLFCVDVRLLYICARAPFLCIRSPSVFVVCIKNSS